MQPTGQDAQGIMLAALLGALAIMAFWRTVLKYTIILVTTAIIATLGYGAIMIWQNMHHVMHHVPR
jgi:hypothetical protein